MSVDDIPLTLGTVLGNAGAARLPRAFLARPAMEEQFRRGLEAQTHLAVFGTPGVGKSALVRHLVFASDIIFVQCLKGQRAPDLYRSILSEAGARIRTETRLSKKRRLSATLKLFSGSFEGGTDSTETEVTIDLGNVGDVFRIIGSKDQRHYIVLNDFHLLPRGVQRRLLGDLQYVYERTRLRFVLIGNWTNSAYLTDLNALIPIFLTDVHVTAWTHDELNSLLGTVQQLLNVSFDAGIVDAMIERSSGSVRELTDICRHLLVDAGVDSPQPATKSISQIARLHNITEARTSRLTDRYQDLLSSYLTVKLVTTDETDIGRFLVRTVGDIMNETAPRTADQDDDDDDDYPQKPRYSYDELREALLEVVDATNQPRLDEQTRRLTLVQELAAGAQRDGGHVSLRLQDLVGGDDADAAEDALRKSAKKLVRAQAKHGFHPPLVAYDPRGAALVSLEPKFRAFLRMDAGDIPLFQRTTMVRIDDLSDYNYRWNHWTRDIKNTAAERRLRALHAEG
jgi:AAA domain